MSRVVRGEITTNLCRGIASITQFDGRSCRSGFVDFAWQLNEPFFDEMRLPRALQVRRLLDSFDGRAVPSNSFAPMICALRGFEFKGTGTGPADERADVPRGGQDRALKSRRNGCQTVPIQFSSPVFTSA
jgi:hypothetical protein